MHADAAVSEAQQLTWKTEAKLPELERQLAEMRAEVRERDLATRWLDDSSQHTGLFAGWEFARAAAEAEAAAAAEPTLRDQPGHNGGVGPEVALPTSCAAPAARRTN